MLRAAARLKSITSHLSAPESRHFAAMSTALFPTQALDKGPKELKNKGLVFLTAQTPNGALALSVSPPPADLPSLTKSLFLTGNKPAYLLEELKAIGAISDYTVIPISFKENEQVRRLITRAAFSKATSHEFDPERKSSPGDFTATQKSEWFEAVNPNGRIPAVSTLFSPPASQPPISPS